MGQVLTARHRAARLQWAQRHFRLERQQWARVLFSAESRFNLSHQDSRIRVFSRKQSAYFFFLEPCIQINLQSLENRR